MQCVLLSISRSMTKTAVGWEKPRKLNPSSMRCNLPQQHISEVFDTKLPIANRPFVPLCSPSIFQTPWLHFRKIELCFISW